MIYCYAHEQKELVKKVKSEIQAKGYKIWFDEENKALPGEKLPKWLARGVSSSRAMLVFYSAAYEKSPTCERELDCAVNQKKVIIFVRGEEKYHADPEGSLAFLMGQTKYHDVTGDRFANGIKDILTDLDHLPPIAKSPVGHVPKVEKGSTKESAATHSGASKQSDIGGWTETDVQKWIKENKIDFLLKKYHHFYTHSLL